ncbi:MAG: acyl-CoA reductase [Candidatus Cybelea sp.]
MVKKPVRSIVAAIASAAARWRDPRFPTRERARDAVSARTTYSPPHVEYALDSLFATLRNDSIETIIADELGCLDVLDGFTNRPGRGRVRALPIGRVCIISSRTTIGVAILPAIFALSAKCSVCIKDREDGLAAAFFATVAEELGELSDCFGAQAWDGKKDAVKLAGFDAIVAFGGDSALAEIANQLPFQARLIAYGSKASAGYVTREALDDETTVLAMAHRAARDLVLYESQGCLSLHALFVERGGVISPARFGEQLAAAIAEAAAEFPIGSRSARQLARLAEARDLATFRAAGEQRVYAGEAAEFLVVVDPPLEEPPLFLPRAIAVRSVDRPDEAAAYLHRQRITLEALAVERHRPDVLEMATQTGAVRIARFGTLQNPPLTGFHGARPRIADFVRWIADET